MTSNLRPLLLSLLLAGCATTASNPGADMTEASEDMGCTDNVPPAQCIAGEAQSERELLNRCTDDVTPIIRDSRVPPALWDGRCALPPL